MLNNFEHVHNIFKLCSTMSIYVTSHEILGPNEVPVEIEILIFSDTYMSLEYTCEISV